MFELRYNKIPFRIIRKNFEDEANEFILKGFAKHLKLVHKPVIINNNRALRYDLSLEHSINKKPFLSINVDENDNLAIIKKFSMLEAYYKKIGTGIFPSQLSDDRG